MSALWWPFQPSETSPRQKVRGPATDALCLLILHLTFWASLLCLKQRDTIPTSQENK